MTYFHCKQQYDHFVPYNERKSTCCCQAPNLQGFGMTVVITEIKCLGELFL